MVTSSVTASAASFQLDYNPELLSNPGFLPVFEAVVEAITEENPNVAYQRFQEIAYKYLDHSNIKSIHTDALRVVLYSNTRDKTDIASALLRAVGETLTRPASEQQTTKAEVQTFPSWAEKTGSTQEKIQISWGGGARFLEEFLEKGHEGYAVEAGKKGIFVTTIDAYRSRDVQYATRTPILHFDDPCIFTAEIDPKELLSVNHNAYEAVLPKKSVPLLQNKVKESWKLADMDFAKRKSCVADTLPAGRFNFETGTRDWRPILVAKAETQYRAERIERILQAYREFDDK